MSRGLLGVLLVALLPAAAAAQPAREVQLGGETWQATIAGGADVLRRADGLTIAVTSKQPSCATRALTAASPRPDWLVTAYWPVVEGGGAGTTTLCLERTDGGALVVVTPPRGKGFDATLAPALKALAEELRPPTVLAKAGVTFHPSLPVVMARESGVAFAIGVDSAATVSATRHPGTCAFDHALTLNGVGKPTLDPAPAGYWPTPYKNADAQLLCVDLREEYLQVLVTPRDTPPALTDVLEALRRAATATYGEALGDDGDVLLPRTQRRLVGGRGAWKVVDGVPFGVEGDVLVSTARLTESTMYAVGVSRGACAPGTAVWSGAGAAFPAQVGTVWTDADPYQLRWKAWACVEHEGVPVTISVVGPIASRAPPDAHEAPVVRELVVRVAEASGVIVRTDPGGGSGGSGGGSGGGSWSGSGGGRRGKATGHAVFYGGVIGLSPDEGDRRYGGLVGASFRMGKRGGGAGAAFDMELGYGGGEFIGEIRAGAGLMVQAGALAIDAVGGLSVGSTGPAAALDYYVETGVGIYGRNRVLWVGVMRAWGVDGPGHDRAELRLGIPGRSRDTATFLGMRYLGFNDDPDTMMPTGSALLVTFGGGFAGLN